MEEYLQALRKQLKAFSPEEQEAFIEEISSHIEESEKDPKTGKNIEQRRRKLMRELGSPKDMGRGLKAVYRPDRLIDYLLIAIPYAFYPLLNSLYINLMPQYSWADVRLDILIHLPLVAIGIWRRSAPLALFWISIIVSQLLYITTQVYWYYGIQTALWAVLLLGLLGLAGYILWRNRNDLLTLVFGALPLSMCIIGNLISVVRPTGHTFYGFLNQSLLIIYLSISDFNFFLILATMALFFLPTNRRMRWLALLLYGLMIGFGREYLIEFQTRSTMTPIAHWVYDLLIILPLLIVSLGWWLEQSNKRRLELATA